MALAFGFAKLKLDFFDPEKILDAVQKAEARAQSKFGAYTRRRMKSSIKYKDGASAPGQPPHAHRSKGFTRLKKDKKTGATSRQSQSPLRELIFFARDQATNSVVIGPVRFGKGAAAIIEKGGRGHAARPFAEPAGRAEAARFPELLRNSVK